MATTKSGTRRLPVNDNCVRAFDWVIAYLKISSATYMRNEDAREGKLRRSESSRASRAGVDGGARMYYAKSFTIKSRVRPGNGFRRRFVTALKEKLLTLVRLVDARARQNGSDRFYCSPWFTRAELAIVTGTRVPFTSASKWKYLRNKREEGSLFSRRSRLE